MSRYLRQVSNLHGHTRFKPAITNVHKQPMPDHSQLPGCLHTSDHLLSTNTNTSVFDFNVGINLLHLMYTLYEQIGLSVLH